MEESVKFTISLSEKDWINYNFHFYFRRMWLRLFILFVSVSLIINALDSLTDANSGNSLLFFAVIFIAFYYMLNMVILYYRASKMYKISRHKMSEIHFEIDHTKMAYSNKFLQVTVSWEGVYRILETKKYLLIFQNPQSANIIIRNQLQPEEYQKLIQLLKGVNVISKKFLKA